MKIKTSELAGAALDWAVAKAEYNDRRVKLHDTSRSVQVETQPRSRNPYEIGWFSFQPSTNWAQGGPIIEREKISFREERTGLYFGYIWNGVVLRTLSDGPTPLVAAMRCFVAAQIGDEVDIPDELEYGSNIIDNGEWEDIPY